MSARVPPPGEGYMGVTLAQAERCPTCGSDERSYRYYGKGHGDGPCLDAWHDRDDSMRSEVEEWLAEFLDGSHERDDRLARVALFLIGEDR